MTFGGDATHFLIATAPDTGTNCGNACTASMLLCIVSGAMIIYGVIRGRYGFVCPLAHKKQVCALLQTD
jgi:hypothetical protein